MRVPLGAQPHEPAPFTTIAWRLAHVIVGVFGERNHSFAEHPLSALVLHIHREAIHHGAEISLLRDLYAAR